MGWKQNQEREIANHFIEYLPGIPWIANRD
jgi:hypothetical protein